MEVVWGDGFGESIAGLDIAGVMGLDQALEASLVNGITTISPRGRYFTVLCWALCEFFESEKGVSGRFDRARLVCFLSRVEFLVLACTALDPGPGDSGGALGRLSYEPELRELSAGKAVEPRESARSAMMAAYFGPCGALGLIKGAESGDPVGFAMTPRGQQIWKARSSALAETDWAGPSLAGAWAPRRREAWRTISHSRPRSLPLAPDLGMVNARLKPVSTLIRGQAGQQRKH